LPEFIMMMMTWARSSRQTDRRTRSTLS